MNEWKDVIYLVSRTMTRDAYGVQQSTEVRRRVRANSGGTTSTEFHEAGRNGLRASSLTFTIKARKYNGEEIVEHKNQRLHVYRTYPVSDDDIELHCSIKGDPNVQESNIN